MAPRFGAPPQASRLIDLDGWSFHALRLQEAWLDALARRPPEGGAGEVEYAMFLGMLAMVVLSVVMRIGRQLNNIFVDVSNGLK
jgi:Flp pilus assembly pilin Flp